ELPRVAAPAGTVLRTSVPPATPTASAKRAYATGATPRRSNTPREKRSSEALTNGRLHHDVSQASAAAPARVAAPMAATFVLIQRSLLTPWVHASLCVPCSTSLATSGAPQNTPISAGKTRNSGMVNWRPEKRLVNRSETRVQSLPGV